MFSVPLQHEQYRQQEAHPECKNELHHEVEVFLDPRQRFELQPAAVTLKGDEPLECGRHHEEVGQARAHRE